MSGESVKLQVQPCDIAFVNWIIEGYEHMGVVSTIDREKGIIVIRSTEDMLPELMKVVKNFSFPVTFLD